MYNELIHLLSIFGGRLLLQLVILPKLGVQT